MNYHLSCLSFVGNLLQVTGVVNFLGGEKDFSAFFVASLSFSFSFPNANWHFVSLENSHLNHQVFGRAFS